MPAPDLDPRPPVHPGHRPSAAELEAWTERALGLAERYERTRQRQALEEAIRLFEVIVEAVGDRDPERARYLDNLGVALLTRFELLGRPEDIGRALAQERAAGNADTPAHPDRPLHLSNLCNAALVSYGVTGNPAELDEAIAAGTAAVELASEEDPDRPIYEANLAAAETTRFEALAERSTRLLDDLAGAGGTSRIDEAITAGWAAIAAAPEDDPRRASVLSNTSHALRLRYEWTGEGSDLDLAVDLARAAAAEDTHLDVGLRLNHRINLGGALLARFQAQGDPQDAREAVDTCRQAVTLSEPGHPDHAVALSNLAGALQGWAIDRSLSDDQVQQLLDEAVTACRRAAETLPEGTEQAVYLGNLTNALLSRYARRGPAVRGDLDDAIATAGRALAWLPTGGADWARVTANLAVALAARSRAGGGREDGAQALGLWHALARTTTVPVSVRLAAAWDAAELAAQRGELPAALDAAAAAVGLLPLLTWQGLQWTSRAEHLARWAGIATDAAALAVHANQPAAGVLLTEHGRAVLWAQILDLRSDLTPLAAVAPGLARRLVQIRELLDTTPAEQEVGRGGGTGGSEPPLSAVR